jgi:hypothetical protein
MSESEESLQVLVGERGSVWQEPDVGFFCRWANEVRWENGRKEERLGLTTFLGYSLVQAEATLKICLEKQAGH